MACGHGEDPLTWENHPRWELAWRRGLQFEVVLGPHGVNSRSASSCPHQGVGHRDFEGLHQGQELWQSGRQVEEERGEVGELEGLSQLGGGNRAVEGREGETCSLAVWPRC